MRKKIKCGGYTLVDGVVMKHPTRTFRMPEKMPQYMKTPYPKTEELPVLLSGELATVHDSIGEENAFRDIGWKERFQVQFDTFRKTELLKEWSEKAPAWAAKILRHKRQKLIQRIVAQNQRDS